MFLSDETLTELIALDVPPEKLARILRMIERDAESVAPSKSSGAERQRRYRERKAADEASQPVTGRNANVTSSHETSPVTESPSPSLSPQTPLSHPRPRVDITTRARGDDDLFERFWEGYPLKKAKKAAETSYRKALKETDHGTLVAAVAAQRGWPEWADPQFIPHAATWLNRGGWNDRPRGSSPLANGAHTSTGRSSDTSFADIIARRRREGGSGGEIPGERPGLHGDDLGWADGAINGHATPSHREGEDGDDASLPF